MALYDPMPRPADPRSDPANPGSASDDDLATLPDKLSRLDGLGVPSAWTDNGSVFVTVPYDDGSIQEHLDAVYGSDRIAIQSALSP